MVKVNLHTNLFKMMILLNMMELGIKVSQRVKEQPLIKMVINIKDNLLKGKDGDKAHIDLINFLDIKDFGKIIVFMGSENYPEIKKFSFRVNFKED